MTLRRLRLLTAGESHGPGLSGILEGLPADLRVSTPKVDKELARRQHGYGSGRRMQIERDRVEWTAGLRFGRTLGSPLAFSIPNRDWANWEERMSVEPTASARRPKPITLARPGHADLAGAIKYDTADIRNVLERASARSTAPRVAAGAVCRQLLDACGVRIWSFVDQLGPVHAFGGADEPATLVPDGWVTQDRRSPTPLRCPDPEAEAAMIAEIDAAIEAGDSVGGSFVVVAEGMPVGIGSNAEWDTRIDTAIAATLMGIQAVKGVEIGLGFGTVSRRGSDVHDEVEPGLPGWTRRTNRAGGTEGGMANGADIVARVAVKPVSTLRNPFDAVDLASGEVRRAHIERSDVAIIPRAAVVGEAMLALGLADALLADLGGDTIGDVRAAVRRRRRRSMGPRGGRANDRVAISALPSEAAAEASPVLGSGRRPDGGLEFCLLGHGVAYSASPAMMNAAFVALGMPHRYVLADVAAEQVPAVVAALRAPDAGGANVTVPHKGAVVSLLDEITDVAREADAVNTIVRRDGRLVGHNTDMPAMIDVIGNLRPDGLEHAIVLGAGGASRAVQLALTKLGVTRITVLRRSDGSIEQLPLHIRAADLLVNATPVGTGSDESPVPAELLRAELAVLDLVYRPNPTRLVRDALEVGAVAEAGSALLLGQAWRAFELWLEQPAPIDVMRTALTHELEKHDA